MDIFTVDNKKLVSESDLKFFKETLVNVFLDGELVFSGSVDSFLETNQYQEDIVEWVRELKNNYLIEMKEISGHWEIELI